MFKKLLGALVFSFCVSAAYADLPVMIDVTGDMSNQPFNVDQKQWGYQFNNATGKVLTFVATVAANSSGAIDLQCWHGKDPMENYTVKPGETSLPCVTDDVIRLVTLDIQNTSATGSYSIKVGSK